MTRWQCFIFGGLAGGDLSFACVNVIEGKMGAAILFVTIGAILTVFVAHEVST